MANEKALELNFENDDYEAIFLKNAIDNFTYWKDVVKKLEKAGKDATREKEYAQAFKVQINAFTNE